MNNPTFNNPYLNNFTIEELQIILGHLKLGMTHLKNQLTSQQFDELEDFGAQLDEEAIKFKSNKTEKFCLLAMVLNSVITGIFGIWMGFATSLELDMASKLMHVSGLSLLCGGILGITIIITNIKKSQRVITQMRFQSFESQVFEAIHQKQENIQAEIVEKLRNRYVQIAGTVPEKEPKQFEKKEDFFSWFYLFHQAIHQKLNEFPKDDIFQQHRAEALHILKQTEETYLKTAELVGNFAVSLRTAAPLPHTTGISVLNILIDPALSKPKVEVGSKTWNKQDIYDLIMASFPTVLGALGSILMWCNSGTVFQELFNIGENGIPLPPHCLPYIKMTISFIFTLNFTFFYIYSQKKILARKAKIDANRKSLLNQESGVVQMSQRLTLMLSLDARIEEMMKFLEYSNIFYRIFKNNEDAANSAEEFASNKTNENHS